MSNKHPALSKELRSAGAQESETARLVEVAGQLRQLKTSGSAYAQTNSRQWWRRWHLVPFGMTAVAGILLGAVLVAYSQTSLPGNWLYPTKRISENIAVAFDPNYRATLMMRRSLEVEELVNRHAGSDTVLATLANYQTQAATYKSTNYAAFEYCKSNLRQAATVASTPVRAAITSTLSSLQT